LKWWANRRSNPDLDFFRVVNYRLFY